jgi:hypothetical protein
MCSKCQLVISKNKASTYLIFAVLVEKARLKQELILCNEVIAKWEFVVDGSQFHFKCRLTKH